MEVSGACTGVVASSKPVVVKASMIEVVEVSMEEVWWSFSMEVVEDPTKAGSGRFCRSFHEVPRASIQSSTSSTDCVRLLRLRLTAVTVPTTPIKL